MRKACWVVIIGCLLSGAAAARDIFVNNVGGDDKNNGLHAQNQGDTASPVRTIAKALRLARAGDHIVLAKSGSRIANAWPWSAPGTAARPG